MIEPNKHGVVSLRAAQNLHKEGVKLDTTFWYNQDGDLGLFPDYNSDPESGFLSLTNFRWVLDEYPAFIPAPNINDILKILPKILPSIKDADLIFSYSKIGYYHSLAMVAVYEGRRLTEKVEGDNLTEAAAKLLLLLYKAKILQGKK